MSEPRPARHAKSLTDLAWVLAAPLAVFLVAARLEWFERYAAWSQPFEHFDVDELVFVLATLAIGMAWYAARRWREARRAQDRLAAVLADNCELAQQLITVQEDERRALARELHDELGQTVTAMRAEAAWMAASDGAAPAAVSATGAAAARIATLADALSGQVRGMLHQLRPAQLDAQGLVAAIQALCEAWEARSGVACVFHHDTRADALGEAVNVAVYRVVQEALSNVLRHARASTVRVTLGAAAQAPGVLRLTVRDDGVGMDVAAPRRGLGLLGAAERAAALGGHLAIDSGAGRGVSLELSLPLARAAA